MILRKLISCPFILKILTIRGSQITDTERLLRCKPCSSLYQRWPREMTWLHQDSQSWAVYGSANCELSVCPMHAVIMSFGIQHPWFTHRNDACSFTDLKRGSTCEDIMNLSCQMLHYSIHVLINFLQHRALFTGYPPVTTNAIQWLMWSFNQACP